MNAAPAAAITLTLTSVTPRRTRARDVFSVAATGAAAGFDAAATASSFCTAGAAAGLGAASCASAHEVASPREQPICQSSKARLSLYAGQARAGRRAERRAAALQVGDAARRIARAGPQPAIAGLRAAFRRSRVAGIVEVFERAL